MSRERGGETWYAARDRSPRARRVSPGGEPSAAGLEPLVRSALTLCPYSLRVLLQDCNTNGAYCSTDPLTYGVIAALVLLISLAATWVPARRATRVDPLAALRDA
jgi:hypothetical protein